MKYIKKSLVVSMVGCFWLLIATNCSSPPSSKENTYPDILNYEVAPKHIQFYYKNSKGGRYKNYKRLREELATKGERLLFAMNGGMYKKGGEPKGLYIEQGNEITPIDRKNRGYGNFYLQPNGVFYIDKDKNGYISTTIDFKTDSSLIYATQSGPMLLIDGQIHPQFNATSTNVNIRNGVGVLPNGNLLFGMSTKEINFYTFAKFFQNHGCNNALYLDGFVSKMYLPSQGWIEEEGDFGVIIGQVN